MSDPMKTISVHQAIVEALLERGWPKPVEDSSEDGLVLRWGDYLEQRPWITASVRRAMNGLEASLGPWVVTLQFSALHVGGSGCRHGTVDEIIEAIDQFRFVMMSDEQPSDSLSPKAVEGKAIAESVSTVIGHLRGGKTTRKEAIEIKDAATEAIRNLDLNRGIGRL